MNELWSWDGDNWTQLTPANNPTARADAGIAYDASLEVLVLFGGVASSGNLNDTWEFNGTDWTEINTLASPTVRTAPSMTYDM